MSPVPPIHKIIEQWLYGRPRSTQRKYLPDVTQALHYLGTDDLSSIDLPDLQGYQSSLIQRRLAEKTVCRKISAVRSLLHFAHEQGFILRDPSVALRSPKVHSTIHERILTREQVQSIIAAAPEGRDHAALRMLYATGARASELCGLLWKDCLPQSNGGVVARLLGKGEKWRSVAVSAAVWSEVAALRGDAPNDAVVFGLQRRYLHDVFKAAAIRAGCPEASCHWFRHSLATHLIDAGMPLPAVRDLLGHSSIAVTNTYAHSRPDTSAADYLEL